MAFCLTAKKNFETARGFAVGAACALIDLLYSFPSLLAVLLNDPASETSQIARHSKMNLAPVVLVSYALVWAAHSQSTETFWNDYPPCERQCHQSVYGNQSCTLQNNCACSGCLCLADSCLCETDSWLIAVSHCIGQECGAAAVTEAASIASSGCDSHSLTLAVSPQSLIQAGLSAVSTSTSPGTSTSSSTSSGELRLSPIGKKKSELKGSI